MTSPIFHSYAEWQLSGVNTWTVNLIRGMEDSGFQSRVLFTGTSCQKNAELEKLGISYDFLNIATKRNLSRKAEWMELKSFLEERAPCIYITNYDFHRSCAVGILSSKVKTVMVIHSDEACYFDELRRLGQDFDAIVCVSSFLEKKVKGMFPKISGRVHCIPHGIPLPAIDPPPRPSEGIIQLLYCNRLQQYQKRILDLPKIASALKKLGVHFKLTIAGEGPDSEKLTSDFTSAGLLDSVEFLGRISNKDIMHECSKAHLFLLTSDFEGLPISLLEAMSVGCVPVVYQIQSGINDVIVNGENGCLIPHGDIEAFAKKLQELSLNRNVIGAMSISARQTIETKFTISRMVNEYSELFMECLGKPPVNRSRKVRPPKDLMIKTRLGKKVKSLFRKIMLK